MKTLICQGLLYAILVSSSAPAFAPTHDQLLAGGKKEGKLVPYASATAPQLQIYFATFNKRYPFIKSKIVSVGAP